MPQIISLHDLWEALFCRHSRILKKDLFVAILAAEISQLVFSPNFDCRIRKIGSVPRQCRYADNLKPEAILLGSPLRVT